MDETDYIYLGPGIELLATVIGIPPGFFLITLLWN